MDGDFAMHPFYYLFVSESYDGDTCLKQTNAGSQTPQKSRVWRSGVGPVDPGFHQVSRRVSCQGSID